MFSDIKLMLFNVVLFCFLYTWDVIFIFFNVVNENKTDRYCKDIKTQHKHVVASRDANKSPINTGKMLHINSDIKRSVQREGVGWHLTDEDI